MTRWPQLAAAYRPTCPTVPWQRRRVSQEDSDASYPAGAENSRQIPSYWSLFQSRGMGMRMPLTSGGIVGYDANRMAYEFTMQNGSELVRCSISSVAMDELSGRWKERSASRDEQFHEFRSAIETMASSLFDNGLLDRGAIRVFAKHFRFKKR
jgi:hypothetical protein